LRLTPGYLPQEQVKQLALSGPGVAQHSCVRRLFFAGNPQLMDRLFLAPESTQPAPFPPQARY
jgi:hypothetical protein